MSDAPERIWAWTRQSKLSPDHVRMDSVWVSHPRAKDGNATEYVRADRIAALEAERDQALAERDDNAAALREFIADRDRLEAERDSYRKTANELAERVMMAEAEVARLREALVKVEAQTDIVSDRAWADKLRDAHLRRMLALAHAAARAALEGD